MYRAQGLVQSGCDSADFPCSPQTLPTRCHQCVIVTSSSHLLGTKLGPEIERAECTIRMNDAPTTGYSADVGNKTTFRVVAHSSVFRVLRKPQEFVNRTPETVFIFWGPPNKMQKPQGSLVRVIQRAGLVFPNMEAYAVSPGRMRQFDDLFRGETGKDRYQPPACPSGQPSALQHARAEGLLLPASTVLRMWSLLANFWSSFLGEFSSRPAFSMSHFQHALHGPVFLGGLPPSTCCSEGRRAPQHALFSGCTVISSIFLGDAL